MKPTELVKVLENETFAVASSKIAEITADMMSVLSGGAMKAKTSQIPALDHYQRHIESRLKWLKSGDPIDKCLPCIEDFTMRADGKLTTFDIVVRPALLRDRLAEYIAAEPGLTSALLERAYQGETRPPDTGPRIDYEKQVDLLTKYLEDRHATTGETSFSILSNQMPFRWAVEEFVGGVTMPAIGTPTVQDKILLPLFLEVNGLLDILDLDLESDPLKPNDVVVRYSIRRPAARNIFGATNQGLDPGTRASLNETQLALYNRLHTNVREGLVFGGRPKLEMSFGAVCSWLIRKASYCLEEPTFLGIPARNWLKQHASDRMLQMEDQFFLPEIYQRMRETFDSRVVKKPEMFGGEIDILFDDVIPIELKVRRKKKEPLDVADVDETFRPGGQAAAYAAVSRLGIVAVLDLPDEKAPVVNLEGCATVIERRFPESAEYPTCIVVIVFRCYQPTPSSSR
jgi:hypothetical protein